MAPARAGFGPLLLLLLLGLWVAEDPLSASPGSMTPAQWFETQHVQPSPQGCNTAMRKISKFSKRCKDLNTSLHDTFLHTMLAHVAHICTTKNINCPTSLGMNCHNSSVQMPVTSWNLIGNAPYSLYKLPNDQTQSLWSPCPVVTQSSLLHVITGQYHMVLVHLHEIIETLGQHYGPCSLAKAHSYNHSPGLTSTLAISLSPHGTRPQPPLSLAQLGDSC
uniref:Ribonuclease A-domain domain-containing protein n=1 Tax=Moschus moschiferus TaxID=68415 RepID=A0A8C6DGI2_MOSMO